MDHDNFPSTDKSLGLNYAADKSTFRVWSPLQNKIELLIYSSSRDIWRESHTMTKCEDGVHEVTVMGDLKGKYYTFLLHGKEEISDPYAIASSVNSIRSAIVDLEETNPEGWESHALPDMVESFQPIIYEVHVKDFTVHPSSGVEFPGKYLGFAEKDTEYKGLSTGISHLVELGITHVHLMPVYDFLTVKEDKEYFYYQNNYNWGYDPELYNVPEGSYSTEPEEAEVRIRELKTLIMELHKSGIKVILDVVYNHTYRTSDSNFERLMPAYYYRKYEDESYSNGSACGNELATEKPMVRRFILDSLLHWVKEYRVDGFRFDLMALIDIDTVEEVLGALREIRPDILIYGEPWTANASALPDRQRTSKGKQGKMKFALFNDDFRDAIKGDNDGEGRGFIQGNLDYRIPTETGIAGSIYYDDGHIGFTTSSVETINYINSHDNLILADKLRRSCPQGDEETLERLNKFALSILFSSQGIPFIHAGNEFMRSKKMVENSYNSPLEVNAIDWSLKEKNL
ncbi:MAG: type I pullulanase, partial [Tissierellaceae bacterium]